MGKHHDPAHDAHGNGSNRHTEKVQSDEREEDAPQPRYRPPEDFLAKDATQVVAFLVRNRGHVDNDVTAAKWGLLDGYSLPLAIYLREIEATGAWEDLEKEIRTAPSLAPAVPNMPRSVRHRKILARLPEWEKRGEGILKGPEEHDPAPAPDITPDTPDTDPPTP
jgi:hypothetical protein